MLLQFIVKQLNEREFKITKNEVSRLVSGGATLMPWE
jgi:hypothetical protein